MPDEQAKSQSGAERGVGLGIALGSCLSLSGLIG